MKILLIEDQKYKSDDIMCYLSTELVDVDIQLARSYSEGVTEVLSKAYDLILLDMTLPIFEKSEDEDGEQMFEDGGRRIMRRMKSKKIVTPCYVITQYDKIQDVTIDTMDIELRKMFPNMYRDYIFYQSNSNVWKTKLSEVIKNAKGSNN